MPCTSKHSASVVEVAASSPGQAGGGHVEEAVEVDAQRAVHRRRAAARASGGACSAWCSALRGGERVVHGVPVAVVVLHVEPRDAQRGRVRERAAELLAVAPASIASSSASTTTIGVVVEQLPAEAGDVLS